MARRKKTDELVEKIIEKEDAIFFRATKPLSTQEHEQLSEKIRYENEKTGLDIVLVPFSCEVGDK
ncbi:hypothetical protein BKP37_12730 [Anaerobacillus alkalilacustris]|uniref:Uncharacterized protein n=1 Tax=Anaerobacillus alkalilacustris TaxID=393763 RepID=A0A1S2LJR4_9BACI|nr:hypothetical protein [Anaerobacillus alkalilacustris]OIJ12661.1 hypothetical protein BKP37_12730 [Anaerobacillus alkalilacustris]